MDFGKELVKANRQMGFETALEEFAVRLDEDVLEVSRPHSPPISSFVRWPGVLVHVEENSLRVVGFEVFQYDELAFVEEPILRDLVMGYRSVATQRERNEFAARLFHALACIVEPGLLPHIERAYEAALKESDSAQAQEHTKSLAERSGLAGAIEALLKGPLKPEPVLVRSFRGGGMQSAIEVVTLVGPESRRYRVSVEPIRLRPNGFLSARIRLPDELGFSEGRFSIRLAVTGPEDEAVELSRGTFEMSVLRVNEQVRGWRTLPEELTDEVKRRARTSQAWKINSLVVIVIEPPDARAGSDA